MPTSLTLASARQPSRHHYTEINELTQQHLGNELLQITGDHVFQGSTLFFSSWKLDLKLFFFKVFFFSSPQQPAYGWTTTSLCSKCSMSCRRHIGHTSKHHQSPNLTFQSIFKETARNNSMAFYEILKEMTGQCFVHYCYGLCDLQCYRNPYRSQGSQLEPCFSAAAALIVWLPMSQLQAR